MWLRRSETVGVVAKKGLEVNKESTVEEEGNGGSGG